MTFDATILRFCGLCAISSILACDPPVSDDLPEDAMAEADEADSDGSEDAEEDQAETEGMDGEGEEGSDGGEDVDPPPRLPVAELEGPCEEHGATSVCWADEQYGVQYCEANAAGWGPCVTEVECELGDTYLDDCGFGEEELGCRLEYGVPVWEECGFTPLVLSFDGQEPRFDAGVEAFELSDGSNACLAREWPGAETPWLAIDLDHSGSIENGRELFGSASPTLDGRLPTDGFDALRDLDENHDGRISPADSAWSSLLLWSDHDRNRASSPWELTPLQHSGLTEIELEHRVERLCDARGNCGIERSQFAFSSFDGQARTGTVIDVHIPCD
ncbi:MAG: calcium-binding protein [Myxococcota bacterium]